MKLLAAILALSALSALSALANAGTCHLAWDAQPGVSFHIWRGVEILATVATNSASITLPDSGPTEIRITAFQPGGFGESPPLTAVVYAFHFQTSSNLSDFVDRLTLYTLQPFIRWTHP